MYIYNRAGADDKPLRMVKTVLHELVKLRGAAIKGHLSMVPIDMKPQPIILAYIDLNLEVLVQLVNMRFLTGSFWMENYLSIVFSNCADFSCSKNVDLIRTWGPNSLG